jgi:hypothetical protein
MTTTASRTTAADPYRIVATLYAGEAHDIAAALFEARREIAQAQPYISWQITPASLALIRADRSLQLAAHALMGALDSRDPEHALAARAYELPR